MRHWLAAGGTLVVLVVLALPGDAAAGRRRFAWLWDTDTLPERTTELEWWAWERAGDPRRAVYLGVAGDIGLTDNLELALPVELGLRADGLGTLASYGLDLRLRLASADAAKAGPVVPLVRVAAWRLVQTDSARFELDAVASADLGALHAVVDVGGFVSTATSASSEHVYLTGGAAVSVAVTDELRLGAELYAEASIKSDEDERWLSVGPNLSYTHGRFWVTASLPIGINRDAPDLLPRVLWAFAF